MDEKTAWYLFETTGNIEAYMLYQDLIAGRAAGRTRPASPPARVSGYRRLKPEDADGAVQPFSAKM